MSDYDVPGPVTAALAQQGKLEPGTPGWWQVWGARAVDIRPGDLVLAGWRDDAGETNYREYEVAEMAPWGGDDRRDLLRVRFLTSFGTFASVGILQPMQLLRYGTRHMLANSI